MEWWRVALGWRWWHLTILSTNLLEVMLLHWSKKFWSVKTCKTDEDDGDEVEDSNTSGMPSLIAPILPRFTGACRCTSSWLPPTLMTVRLSNKARLLHQDGIARLWHRLFLHIKPEPSLCSGPGTPHRGWVLAQSKWGLLVSLCLRPIDVTIKASLTRRNRILNVVNKEKLWSPDIRVLLGNRM